MRFFKSKEKITNPKTHINIPIWKLDAETHTVTHFNTTTMSAEHFYFFTDFIKYHINFVADKYPSRFKKLIENGEIIAYLNNLESEVDVAIDKQIEIWKENDMEYLTAVQNGDIEKANGLLNMLRLMAREVVFEEMIYR